MTLITNTWITLWMFGMKIFLSHVQFVFTAQTFNLKRAKRIKKKTTLNQYWIVEGWNMDNSDERFILLSHWWYLKKTYVLKLCSYFISRDFHDIYGFYFVYVLQFTACKFPSLERMSWKRLSSDIGYQHFTMTGHIYSVSNYAHLAEKTSYTKELLHSRYT